MIMNMAKIASTLDWQTIDPTFLPVPVAKQYERYKAAYREMKAERDSFETAMREMAPVPAGKRLVIGYNFGKLSVAIASDDAKPSPAKGAVSLSDFLATQSAQGKRT